FYFFTWRDIKIKYKQTAFGVLWAILQPFLLMIIFTLFFGRALGVPSDNIPYPLFVYSGLLLWNIFSSGLANASNSMVSNANIIKKIYFPRLIIPMSAILVALFDFFMALIVFAGILVYYQFPFDGIKFLLLFPLSLSLCVISTFGAGTLLAALNVKYRDVRYVIPFLIQALLFITPVIYPVSIFNNHLAKIIMAFNPMTGAIVLFRSVLTNQVPEWNIVIIGICSALVLLITGLFYFRKTEAYFADLA